MRAGAALPPPVADHPGDVDRITGLGVKLKLNHPIDRPPEALLNEGFDAVFVASGFQRDTPLHIQGHRGARA